MSEHVSNQDYSDFDDAEVFDRLESFKAEDGGIYLVQSDLLKYFFSDNAGCNIGLGEFTVLESHGLPGGSNDPVPAGERRKIMKYFQGRDKDMHAKTFLKLFQAIMNKPLTEVKGLVSRITGPENPTKGMKFWLAVIPSVAKKSKRSFAKFAFFVSEKSYAAVEAAVKRELEGEDE